MKVVILQEDLFKTLNFVSRFVSTRAQIPVLSNIFISAKKGGIRLAATNLEMGISVRISAKVEKEGILTIPAKIITELISNIPSGQVILEQKQSNLILSTSLFSSSINSLPANEFPNIADKPGKETISLTVEILKTCVNQVVFSASTDEARPELTGVLFIFGDKTKMVATDGFRLSVKEIDLSSVKIKIKQLLIPSRIIDEANKILTDKSGTVDISILEKEKQIILSNNSIVLSGKVLEGNFPDFERIIPKKWDYKIITSKDGLGRAVRSASVFAREGANVVKIGILKDKIRITAESQQYGNEEVFVEAKTEGGEVEIAYNYRYILEFLNSVSGDEVSIETEGAMSPGVFKDVKDSTYTHLIMPVRIQN